VSRIRETRERRGFWGEESFLERREFWYWEEEEERQREPARERDKSM